MKEMLLLGLLPGLFTQLSASTVATISALPSANAVSLPADSLAPRAIADVVVTGTRRAVDARLLPMSLTVIDHVAIAESHEPSLMPLLNAQVPSLFVTGRGILGYGVSTGGSGGIKIRGVGGSPTTGVLILIDGQPQYQGLMGHSVADMYKSMLADRVEVVRGPASMLYGSNALCGVVNIVTRQAKREGVATGAEAAYGSYNTLTASFHNSVRRGQFRAVIAGDYGRTDGHRTDLDFEQASGFMKLGYDFSPHWSAMSDVSLTRFDASNPGSVDAPLFDNDSRIIRGMASVAVTNDYERTSGSVRGFVSWGRHKIDDGYAPGSSPAGCRFHSSDHVAGLSFYQNLRPWSGACLTAGFDGQQIGGRARNVYDHDGSAVTLVDTTVCDVAGYVALRQRLFDCLVLDAGVRLDRHSVSGTEWIPQWGVGVELPGDAQLKALVSKGFRNPTLRELFMWRAANRDLRAERLWNYELSYTRCLADRRLQYRVGVYYIEVANLIETVYLEGRSQNVNAGRLYHWGVEAEASCQLWAHGRLCANYSYLHTSRHVLAAPAHKLNIAAHYDRGRWSVAPSLQYIAGLCTLLESDHKENYLLLNLRLDCRVTDTMAFFATGDNLLAQRYAINAGYPMPLATVMAGVKLTFN